MVARIIFVFQRSWHRGALAFASLIAIAGCQMPGDVARADAWRGFPDEISRKLAEGQTIAIDPMVDAKLAGIAAEAQRVAANGNRNAAAEQLALLNYMIETLAQEYSIRIVSRQGEVTGFFRQSQDNPVILNYYLVVEAVAPDGRVLTVWVSSAETQKTERVKIWAQRVTRDMFDEVGAEKAASGMVVNAVLGRKTRGELEPQFDEPVPGGAITEW